MGSEMSGGGYSFNTGVAQVEFISHVSNAAVKQYLQFQLDPSQENYDRLCSILETFGLTITARADTDDLEGFTHITPGNSENPERIDVLRAVDNLPEEPEKDALDNVRHIFIEIVQLMKALNLDIPENREVDPDDVV